MRWFLRYDEPCEQKRNGPNQETDIMDWLIMSYRFVVHQITGAQNGGLFHANIPIISG